MSKLIGLSLCLLFLGGWTHGASFQINAPSTATVTNSTAGSIPSVSLSGGGGTYTAVVNGFGQLQCSGGSSTFGGTLTTTGILSAVNSDLAGLTDDAPSGSNADTINYNATDSVGGAAAQKTTAVTVN